MRTQGVPVQARVQGIEENESIQVNGRSPYRISAQWQDPATSQIHLFYSGNIWFDPTEYVTREHITVLLDRKNPKALPRRRVVPAATGDLTPNLLTTVGAIYPRRAANER